MSTLVHNERVKLTASALNTAATSSFTVGVVAPIAAALYSFGPTALPVGALVLLAVAWLGAAVALHLAAPRVLGSLVA